MYLSKKYTTAFCPMFFHFEMLILATWITHVSQVFNFFLHFNLPLKRSELLLAPWDETPHCEGQVWVQTQLVTEPLQGGSGIISKWCSTKKTAPVWYLRAKQELVLMNNICSECSATLLFKAYEGLCCVRQVAMKQIMARVYFTTTNGLLRYLKHTWKASNCMGKMTHLSEKHLKSIWSEPVSHTHTLPNRLYI